MSKRNLQTAFENFANKYLLEIESFRLYYCRTRKLPKTFWLAEDILGLTRIIPCVYGQFFAENVNFPESDAKEIKSIFQLLNSLHVMVSTLMNPRTATDTDTIEVYVKFFLSCVHRSSHLVYGSGDYFWGKKVTFSLF